MQKAAKRRPSANAVFDGGCCGPCRPSYFIAPDAALIPDDAAIMAEDAASIAEFAAEEAESIAEEAAIDGSGVEIVAGGGVVTVVVSSFLVQAANETAAARVTINNAVFMFLLDSSADN